MLKRHLEQNIICKISHNNVLYLNGPRQCGKSTLIYNLKDQINADYLTFDHYANLMKARNDPEGFLDNSPRNLILDEVQLAPEIFRPLKAFIDTQRINRTSKKIILTGSVDIMSLPFLSDALVGRMNLLTLYPLSVSESLSLNKSNIHDLFNEAPLAWQSPTISFKEAIALSTFPEIVVNDMLDKYDWFENYITTLLHRDIKQLADIQKIAEFPKVLGLLAARVGGLLNDTNIAVESSLSLTSYRRYRSLLEAVFMIYLVPAWHANQSKRLIKSPKLYFNDTMLLLHLLRQPLDKLTLCEPVFGHIIENFVGSELSKAIQGEKIRLYHYRDTNQTEVDFVLENAEGDLVAIEVKAKTNISNRDLNNLKSFQKICGEKLKKCYVMHLGNAPYPIEKGFEALPINFFFQT